MKKLLSFVVVLVMLVGVMSTGVMAEGSDIGSSIVFYDGNGNIITTLDEVESVCAKITFDAADDVATIIVSSYDSTGRFTGVKFIDEEATSPYTTPLFSVSETELIKFFAFEDMTTMKPLLSRAGAIAEAPTATVQSLNVSSIAKEADVDLSSALNFKADDSTKAQLEAYGDWYADFVLTINKDITLNANGTADGYLAGQYDNWSKYWVKVPTKATVLKAGEPFRVMATGAEQLGKKGLKYTYREVYDFVKDFDCGIYFSTDFIKANPGLKATLSLRMFNPENEAEYYVVGDEYTFDYTLPEATVTALDVEQIKEEAGIELSSAVNFATSVVTPEQLGAYSEWYTDFAITVNKDVTFNATGEGSSGYLAGQYDAYSASWLKVPSSAVSLSANDSIKIMETAAELLGKKGLKYTYKEIYAIVKDFNCGIYFNDEFLAENPDLEVTLELRLYNPVNEQEYIVIGDTYDFQFEPKAVDKFVSNDNLSFQLGNNGTVEVKLGQIFAPVEGANISNAALSLSISGDNCEYIKNEDDWTQSTLKFTGAGQVHFIINDNNYCTDASATVTITKPDDIVKFENKFNKDFLYRVGNANNVALSSLFSVKDGVEVGDVSVTVDSVDNTCATGTYKENADWKKAEIDFNGTGIVKVTITDNAYCIPTELYLEVVDAKNTTTAASATANNVVLLNNVGFSTIEVSGGYTLYGNGFTMTCGSDSVALDFGYEFVKLNNGILDNVQIDCPNFDYAALYKSNLTSSDNRSQTTDKTRYYNARSGVMSLGNSRILNSRISGGRASVNVSGGNLLIDNSQIERGAVASILVGAANNLTLRDVTLIQKPTVSTHDANKTLMGFSVLYMCDSEGNAAPTTIEGSLVQQAWIDEDDIKYVPSDGESIVKEILNQTEYLHDIDGDGVNESLNLGFAYMPENVGSSLPEPKNITDNRINKDTVPYETKKITPKVDTGFVQLTVDVYVYSYKNTNGTSDDFKAEKEYVPNKYGDIVTASYSDVADGLTQSKSLEADGWVYELNVDLDKLGSYNLDFSKLSMNVNGKAIQSYMVDGNAAPTSPVEVTSGGVTYTLTATVDGKEHTAYFKVIGTETSKDSPMWSSDANGTSLSTTLNASWVAGTCVASSYGGTWSGAAPALENVFVRYWSVAEKKYKTINLADYTPKAKGKLNGTNTTWTYTPDNGDFTLTLTGGQVHSSNNVYAMPVVVEENGKYTLYFVASDSKGLVNSGNSARTVPVSYTFKDNNGGTALSGSHTWSVAEDTANQYSYSDFCNGTKTKLEKSNTGTCLAEGTLITMADGSKRAVEDLRKGDKVMVYDHLNGNLTSSDVIIVVKTSSDMYYKNTFVFDDGTTLATINEHGIYDLDLCKYVNIDHLNYSEFIGHRFVSVDSKGNIGFKTLVDVLCEVSSGYKYDIVTDGTLNYVAEDTLSVTHVLVDVINSFDFAEDMTYDKEKMNDDIEKYGLYSYNEWSDYCDISVFNEYNIPVMKVGISKGMYTKEYIIGLINTYVLDDSVQIID